jgi:hypothetical protein
VFSVRCEGRPKKQVTVSFTRQAQDIYRKHYRSLSAGAVQKIQYSNFGSKCARNEAALEYLEKRADDLDVSFHVKNRSSDFCYGCL